MVKEASLQTQFLIITHNKLSMSFVKSLIGITMQEKGVSTAIRVDFKEREAEIDKWIANA